MDISGTLITAKMLRGRGACKDQIDTFEQTWPDGAELTLDNLIRAAKLDLSIEWFAENFLSDPAGEAYMRTIAPALWGALEEVE